MHNYIRVFIFCTEGLAGSYGIGRYLKTIRDKAELYNETEIKFFFIERSSESIELSFDVIANNTIIKLPSRTRGSNKITNVEALAILCQIDEVFEFTDQDIIHINNNDELAIVKMVRDYFPCRILYVIHVMMWQVFFNSRIDIFSDRKSVV